MGDGAPQGVEYRPPVGARSDAGPASYEGGVADEDRIHPQDFFDLVEGNRELMLKRDRPCIVVVRLRFHGKRRDFAVPLRSNIAPNVPKDQYFALPPRPTTRPGCRHGIHYIKMFPITKAYQRRYCIWFALLRMAINARDASACASAFAARSAPPPHPRDAGFLLEPTPASSLPAVPREPAAPWCSSLAA